MSCRLRRENAEAIAFYGGDVCEASDLSSRLIVVLDVLLRRIAWLGAYELWLVVYRWGGAGLVHGAWHGWPEMPMSADKPGTLGCARATRTPLCMPCRYATVLVPSLVLAPEYFAGKIEFGTLTQVSGLDTHTPRLWHTMCWVLAASSAISRCLQI